MPLFEMTTDEITAAGDTLQLAAFYQDPRALVLLKAAACILGARNGSYGEPEDNFGRIAARRRARGHQCDAYDVAEYGMDVKEGRLEHDPWHADSHVDLIGYAACRARIAALEWEDDRETREAEAELRDTEESFFDPDAYREKVLAEAAAEETREDDQVRSTGLNTVWLMPDGSWYDHCGAPVSYATALAAYQATADTDDDRRLKLAKGTWGHKSPQPVVKGGAPLATRPCAWPEQCRRFGCQGGCGPMLAATSASTVTVAAQDQQFQGLAA